ncbi:MAG: MFS transporter [Desulfobacterales bacterium]|nr:MFS transporter [Desulfobacterales bacterium]
MDKSRKAVWGWALYDWGNSAFATTVMAGFFPVFFKQYWSVGADVNESTAMLGFGNSAASLLVALMAPILGAIADRGSAKKNFLTFFAYLGVLMTAALFFVGKGQWQWAIFLYVMGVIGFSGSNIFYDSLLPSVAGEEKLDSVSSFGFALGYLGGGLLFLVNVLMTLKPAHFGLPDAAAAVRYSFLTVALWWGVFAVFTLVWVEEPAGTSAEKGPNAIAEGLRRFARTLGQLRQMKTLTLFLIAYWFYIDGVDTIIRMAVDYGMSLGFEANSLIVALLIVQFIGFPFALLFGWLGQKWGVKKSIYLTLFIYIGVTLYATFLSRKIEFYLLAVAIATVQGGVQALSRSWYARMIPANRAAEFYGFYNMLGKFAAIIGPALMGVVGLTARRLLMPASPTALQIKEIGLLSTRWSMASVVILFVIGMVLLHFVDEEKGKKEAAELPV